MNFNCLRKAQMRTFSGESIKPPKIEQPQKNKLLLKTQSLNSLQKVQDRPSIAKEVCKHNITKAIRELKLSEIEKFTRKMAGRLDLFDLTKEDNKVR